MLKPIKNLLKANSLLLAIFITILIAFLSLTRIGTQQPIDFKYLDKVEHCIAYATLSFVWLLNLGKRKMKTFLIILLCIIYGVFIEALQGTTSYRTFDYLDMIANAVGVLVGYMIFVFLIKSNKLTD